MKEGKVDYHHTNNNYGSNCYQKHRMETVLEKSKLDIPKGHYCYSTKECGENI